MKSMIGCAAWVLCVAATYAQDSGTGPNKRIRNPVTATSASIAAGKETYTKYCSHCHGPSGAGDGRFAPKDPAPPDLTDAKWDHGSGEADIFLVIANGPSEKSAMKPFKVTLAEKDIWNVVNYVVSIGRKAR